MVTDTEYMELTNTVLNELKDAINFIAERERLPVEKICPHYPEFLKKEVKLVRDSMEPMRARIDIRQFADRVEKQAIVVKASADEKRAFILNTNGEWEDISGMGAFALHDHHRLDVRSD